MDSLHSIMPKHEKESIYHLKNELLFKLVLKMVSLLGQLLVRLDCSPSTISYEVKRGTVLLYHGKAKTLQGTTRR
jgi:hypothetical protein